MFLTLNSTFFELKPFSKTIKSFYKQKNHKNKQIKSKTMLK